MCYDPKYNSMVNPPVAGDLFGRKNRISKRFWARVEAKRVQVMHPALEKAEPLCRQRAANLRLKMSE